MNYFQTQLFYYTVLVKEITETDYETVYRKLWPIFCPDCKTGRMREFFQNKVFCRLTTSHQVEMRMSFLTSFARNSNTFGTQFEEFEALKIKKKALAFGEMILSEGYPATAGLVKFQKERGQGAPLLALLAFFKNPSEREDCFDSSVVAMLNSALKNGDLDAGLLLLYASDAEQYNIVLREIKKSVEYNIYPELKRLDKTIQKGA